MLEAVTGVQPTLERMLHLFGTIKGEPVDPVKGIYKSSLIVEKPSIDLARETLVTPGLQAGNYPLPFRPARVLAAHLRLAGIPDPQQTSAKKGSSR